MDSGFGNTGSCTSAVCFINGKRGFCGYPIEQLAENAAFSKVCYLLIYSELPNKQQAAKFCDSLTHHSMIHEDIKKFFEGNLPTVHLMAILSSMVTSLSTYYPDAAENDVDLNMVRLLAKVNTIAS